jgi:hypothetical protein
MYHGHYSFKKEGYEDLEINMSKLGNPAQRDNFIVKLKKRAP